MRDIIPEKQNPLLRKKAQAVAAADIGGERINSLLEDMKSLLAKEEFGVALAAPQVGEPLRVFIVSGKAVARDARNALDEPEDGEDEEVPEKDLPSLPDQIYINPELIKISRRRVGKHEGCLSIRGKWGVVPRAEKATVRAYDENGNLFTRGASGFLAHVFQHEMDHLEGILYTDKATEINDDKPEDEHD